MKTVPPKDAIGYGQWSEVLDRGDLAAWRELYALAADDRDLRRWILGIVVRVPLPYPYFWHAVMSSLGERVDSSLPPAPDPGIA